MYRILSYSIIVYKPHHIMKCSLSRKLKNCLVLEALQYGVPLVIKIINISTSHLEDICIRPLTYNYTSTDIYLYIYGYIFVHPRVYIYTSTDIYLYVHGYIFIHPRIYIYTSTDIYLYIHGYIFIHPRIYIYISMDIYLIVHPWIYICTSTDIYLYIYGYINIHLWILCTQKSHDVM